MQKTTELKDTQFLERKAKYLRRQALEMMENAQKGHIGGSFSCIEILVALYYDILKYDPKNLDWEERDRFILSKGHATLAYYPVLQDVGYFDECDYCQEGSIFEGHPNRDIPGVEVGTGSLGQGLGIGAGMALAAKMDEKDYNVFVLLGDGECYEGTVWEAAQFASHHRLNNLIAIVDRNKQCAQDYTEDCNKLEPLDEKWGAFGWSCLTFDGHNFNEMLKSIKDALQFNKVHKFRNEPVVFIANTIKGKGVSFMEGAIEWHNKLPNEKELTQARLELA